MENLEMLQFPNDIKNDKLEEITYTGYYCSARFRKCLIVSCYLIALLIFIMELIRSFYKDGDILALVTSLNAYITNVSKSA